MSNYEVKGDWITFNAVGSTFVYDKKIKLRPVFITEHKDPHKREVTYTLSKFEAYRCTDTRNTHKTMTIDFTYEIPLDSTKKFTGTVTIDDYNDLIYSEASNPTPSTIKISNMTSGIVKVPIYSFKDFLSKWKSGIFDKYDIDSDLERDICEVPAEIKLTYSKSLGNSKTLTSNTPGKMVLNPFPLCVPHITSSLKVNEHTATYDFIINFDSELWINTYQNKTGLSNSEKGLHLYKKVKEADGSEYLIHVNNVNVGDIINGRDGYLDPNKKYTATFEDLDENTDYVILSVHPYYLAKRSSFAGGNVKDMNCSDELWGWCDAFYTLPVVNVARGETHKGDYIIKYNNKDYIYDAPLFRVEFSVGEVYVSDVEMEDNNLDCDNAFHEYGLSIKPTTWTTNGQYFKIENMTRDVLEILNEEESIFETETDLSNPTVFLKGLKSGTGKIKITPAKQENNATISYEIEIECYVPAKDITIHNIPVPAYVDEKVPLFYSIESYIDEQPSTDNEVVISSNNDSICTILDNYLYGKAEGNTTIEVKLIRREGSKQYSDAIIKKDIPVEVSPTRQLKEMPKEKSNTLEFGTISSMYVNLGLIKDRLTTLVNMAQITINEPSPTLEIVDVRRGFTLTPDELMSEIQKLERDIISVGAFVESIIDDYNEKNEEKIEKFTLPEGSFTDADDSFDFVLSRFEYCNFLISATDSLLGKYVARLTSNSHARICGGDMLYEVAQSKSDTSANLKNTLISENQFFNVMKDDGTYAGISGYNANNTDGINGVWSSLSDYEKSNAVSFTFAVKPGDKIYTSSMKNNSSNGGSITGTPMVFFEDEKPIYSISAGRVNYKFKYDYDESHMLVPTNKGNINAVSIVLWNSNQNLYLWREG